MSITYLRRGYKVLTDYCITGITANEDFLRKTVEHSIGLVTAISPRIGYENATAVAKQAQATGQSVREVVIGMSLLSAVEFDEILGDIDRLTGRG